MHFLLTSARCRTFDVARSLTSQLRPITASRFCAAASPGDDEHSPSKTLNPGWLDIRVGQITTIRKHPDAAKLYIEEVNVGEPKPRTIVSGLVAYCSESDLLHRNVLVLCNLRPAKLKGIISHGMILCASGKESVEPLDPPPDSVPGDRACFNGYEATRPLAILHPKKRIWEQVQKDFTVSSESIAQWTGNHLVTKKGVVRCKSLTNVEVK